MIDHAILRLRSQHGHHSLKLLYNDITNMGHLDAVSADKTSLGFEFQDLVFIEKLLELKPGESLGLEVLDAIPVDLGIDIGLGYTLGFTGQQAIIDDEQDGRFSLARITGNYVDVVVSKFQISELLVFLPKENVRYLNVAHSAIRKV